MFSENGSDRSLTGAIPYLQQTMLIVLLQWSEDEYKTSRFFRRKDENRRTFH